MKDSRIKRVKQRLRHLLDDRPRRIRLLIAQGLICGDSDIPQDAIPIDPEYSTKLPAHCPELYYQDIDFHCSDCQRPETWTAESQQYYFEVMKSPPFKRAKRCYDCREKVNAKRDEDRARTKALQPSTNLPS